MQDSVKPVVEDCYDPRSREVGRRHCDAAKRSQRAGLPIEGETDRESPSRPLGNRLSDADRKVSGAGDFPQTEREVHRVSTHGHTGCGEIGHSTCIGRQYANAITHGPALLENKPVVAVAVTVSAVDAAADIRGGVDSLKLGPLDVDSGELLGCDLVNLLGQRSHNAVDITRNGGSLVGVVNLATELADDVGLGVDLGLHLALLQITELVVDHSGLVGDSRCDGGGVAVGLPSESGGLLQRAELRLIALLDGEKFLVAAALLEVADDAGVAGSDLVDDLRNGDGLLESESAESVLDVGHTCVYEVEVLSEGCRQALDRGAGRLALRSNCVHDELSSAVVVELVGEKPGSSGATAKATEAAAPVTSAPTEH